MKIYNEDTISAVGTRPGEAAIGIVKLSGNKSISITKKIFKPKTNKNLSNLPTYNLIYGNIVDKDGNIVDEVIVTLMKKPKSYTREDVVEINCHGGIVATTKVLEMCVENGSRIAEPGEFTKRAFLNGRIDLSQAEAVIELVRTRTEQGLKIAAKNIEGNVGKEIRKLRKMIMDVLIQLEASIDFNEEDLEIISFERLAKEVKKIKERLVELVKDCEKGEIVKNGVKVTIVGKPNVGKSSLLNLLSKKEKAIVTPIPGTTRDAVEEILYVEGIPLVLVDTAGIRKTKSTIEKMGVERSLKHIEEAELVIFVLDGSIRIGRKDMDIIERIKRKKTICCINKVDLKQIINIGSLNEYFSRKYIVRISALKGTGLKKLENRIRRAIIDNGDINLEDRIVINSRHKTILKEAVNLLENAEKAMKNEMSEEFPSYDLRAVHNLIGEIIGETAGEDILEKIFGRFCIGK